MRSIDISVEAQCGQPKLPLVTAQVLHFNNGELIYQTIDSVLMQDYPQIELIVSDDCSQGAFYEEEIRRYLEQKAGRNILQWQVRRNTNNVGTVRHLELLRGIAHGEIELSIAADDVWRDQGAFRAFVDVFLQYGEKCEWVVSQVEMRDEALEKSYGLFVRPSVISMIQTGQFERLLNREASACLLPGCGSAFRRSFFEKVGTLSGHYDLVEDYSAHLRALRLGIPVYFLDRVTVLHRHGGVSHGNRRNGTSIHLRYQKDFLTAYRREVQAHRECYQLLPYLCATLVYWNNLLLYHTDFNELKYGRQDSQLNGKESRFGRLLWKISRLAAVKRVLLLWCAGCLILLLLRCFGLIKLGVAGRHAVILGIGILTIQLSINILLKIWRLIAPLLRYARQKGKLRD